MELNCNFIWKNKLDRRVEWWNQNWGKRPGEKSLIFPAVRKIMYYYVLNIIKLEEKIIEITSKFQKI